jgi:hypothetical protein
MKRIGAAFPLLPRIGHGGYMGLDSTDLTGAVIAAVVGGAVGAGVDHVVDQVSD